MTLALFAFWAAACVNDPPMKSIEPEAPPIEVGVLAGRDGVAFGPGILLQGNLGRLGLYGFAETSSITGYSTSDGVKANLRDRTLGFGIQYRIVRMVEYRARPRSGIKPQESFSNWSSSSTATCSGPRLANTWGFRRS